MQNILLLGKKLRSFAFLLLLISCISYCAPCNALPEADSKEDLAGTIDTRSNAQLWKDIDIGTSKAKSKHNLRLAQTTGVRIPPSADKQRMNKQPHEDKAPHLKKDLNKESDKIPHLSSWRRVSYLADRLIDENKYEEAEKLLTSILPRARKEAPESPDFALALCRLGSDLYALKKYPQASARLQESIEILNRNQSSVRQRKILWRSMATRAAVLLRLQKNAEAESLARKSVAYAVAFPDIASPGQIKIAYVVLKNSLQAQKKFAEAKKIDQIMKNR